VSKRPVSPRRLTALVSTLVFLDMITWLAAIPLIPVWHDEFGLSDDQAGLVLSSYSLAVLVCAIPAGWVADRIGARRLTLIAAGVFVLVAPSIALADTFALLLVVRVVQGACSAVVWSAGLAWLSSAVGPEHRPRSLSIANTAAGFATVGGPLLGGPIVSAIGIGPSFVGLGCLLALFVVWGIVEPGGESGVVARGDRSGPFSSLRKAVAPGLLQVSFLSIGFVALMMAAIQLVAPLHLAALGLSSSAIGWFFTVGSALSVCSLLVVARLGARLNYLLVLIALPSICGACVLLLLIPLGPIGYGTVLVVVLALAAPIFTIAYTVCADGAQQAGVGEGGAFGMLNAIWAIGSVVAPVVAGVLTQHGVAWIIYGFVGLLSFVVSWLLTRARAVGALA